MADSLLHGHSRWRIMILDGSIGCCKEAATDGRVNGVVGCSRDFRVPRDRENGTFGICQDQRKRDCNCRGEILCGWRIASSLALRTYRI